MINKIKNLSLLHFTPSSLDVHLPGSLFKILRYKADRDIFGLSKIHCQGKFIVSIWVLKDDIKNSVLKPGGYLDDLKNDGELQSKFVTAINQIYENTFVLCPTLTDLSKLKSKGQN
jgi:hypothetical protein